MAFNMPPPCPIATRVQERGIRLPRRVAVAHRLPGGLWLTQARRLLLGIISRAVTRAASRALFQEKHSEVAVYEYRSALARVLEPFRRLRDASGLPASLAKRPRLNEPARNAAAILTQRFHSCVGPLSKIFASCIRRRLRSVEAVRGEKAEVKPFALLPIVFSLHF